MSSAKNNTTFDLFTTPGLSSSVISVSSLNRLAREIMESALPSMWVAGEISNLMRAASGHIYFTLKDTAAQARCAIWRSRANLLPFRPENGMRVEARAQATLFEARGEFQLTVETLRPAGVGSLFEAFQRLKDKLADEGLFDAARHRPLPTFPASIGIVTSPAAAALQDVLVTLERRAPGLPVVLYPAMVQGADAPVQLIRALETAGQRASRDGIEVIVLVRGGGSLEDLWAFNDEGLARTIAASPLPVVVGVGHETDFTIADFVADQRAPTPTGAAELVSAGYFAAIDTLRHQHHRLTVAMERSLQSAAQRVDRAALQLIHPRQRLQQAHEQLQQCHLSLAAGIRRTLEASGHRLSRFSLQLQALRPEPNAFRSRIESLEGRLQRALRQRMNSEETRLAALAASLEHLGPKAVLSRGYSITRDANGKVLRSVKAVRSGERIDIELTDGHLGATVIR